MGRARAGQVRGPSPATLPDRHKACPYISDGPSPTPEIVRVCQRWDGSIVLGRAIEIARQSGNASQMPLWERGDE